jgi:predicted Na+-dependent transporter
MEDTIAAYNVSIVSTSTSIHSINSSSTITAATVASQVLMFLMTLGLSATVQFDKLRQRLAKDPKAVWVGVGLQYTIVPLVGLCTVLLLQPVLTPPMAISLLVLTASPGGSYSTWWTATWNGDVPLSVAMTTISSILGVILLPLNIWMTTSILAAYSTTTNGTTGTIDTVSSQLQPTEQTSVVDLLNFTSLLLSLAVVVVAILAGLSLGYLFDTTSFRNRMNWLGNLSGLGLVVVGMWSSFHTSGNSHSPNEDQYTEFAMNNLEDIGATPSASLVAGGSQSNAGTAWPFLYLAVIIPCVLCIWLPNVVARYWLNCSKPETITIAIECCYQNNGIATSVALAMFSNATDRTQALAVPLVYGVMEAMIIFFYGLWAWKSGWTNAPPGATLWSVLFQSFENEAGNVGKEVPWSINDIVYSPVAITVACLDEEDGSTGSVEVTCRLPSSTTQEVQYKHQDTLETVDTVE